MNEQQIMQQIQGAFRTAFGSDPQIIHLGATPDQIPGWDSLGHAVLASTLEQVFNVSFDIDELMEMEDVSSILKVMQNKGL